MIKLGLAAGAGYLVGRNVADWGIAKFAPGTPADSGVRTAARIGLGVIAFGLVARLLS